MMLTYHGVLAPAAGMRDRVVPPPPLPDDDEGNDAAGDCDHGGHRERHRPHAPRSTHSVGEASGQPLDNDPLRRSRARARRARPARPPGLCCTARADRQSRASDECHQRRHSVASAVTSAGTGEVAARA